MSYNVGVFITSLVPQLPNQMGALKCVLATLTAKGWGSLGPTAHVSLATRCRMTVVKVRYLLFNIDIQKWSSLLRDGSNALVLLSFAMSDI